jgi:hypothetical protein
VHFKIVQGQLGNQILRDLRRKGKTSSLYKHEPLQGTAAPTPTPARVTAVATGYRCIEEVQLLLRGTAAPTRYNCTYEEVQLHLQGSAAPTRYSYTFLYGPPTSTLEKTTKTISESNCQSLSQR